MNFLRITLKNIWHRKVRTCLTILGVGVSIAAFIALVGISNNLAEMFQTHYKTRGTDLIIMEKGTIDFLTSSVDEEYYHSIKKTPGVLDVSAILVDLYAMGLNQFVLLYGWHLDSYLFEDLKIDGRRPEEQNEAILGERAAQRLNKKVGDELNIKGVQFKIVGIFQSKSLFEEGAIIVPLERLQEIRKIPSKVTMLNVKVDREKYPNMDLDKAIEYVRSNIEKSFPNLEVNNVQTFMTTNNPLVSAINFTWAISVIAFIIAILGIVNTMTTSVMERTREIGILLAMGWRNTRIVTLILHESTLLGFLGGIVGLILGYGIMGILINTPHLKGIMIMEYDIIFMIKAIVISLFLGLISGIYPALKAISTEPIKVLRYE